MVSYTCCSAFAITLTNTNSTIWSVLNPSSYTFKFHHHLSTTSIADDIGADEVIRRGVVSAGGAAAVLRLPRSAGGWSESTGAHSARPLRLQSLRRPQPPV